MSPIRIALPAAVTGVDGTPSNLPSRISELLSPADSSPLDGGTPHLETSDLGGTEYIRQPRYGSNEHDDFAPTLPREAQFRHSGWGPKRNRIYRAMLHTGQSCRRVANFADCGNTLWLHRDGRELCLTCNKCHDRLCEPCQREKQTAVQEAIMLKCHDAVGDLRFVTLTLRHSDTPLALQIDRLTSSFKLLRKHPAIAPAMAGGVWFLEVKLDKAGVRWHPHLHCIVEGTWLDQKTLSKAWYETTGDSYIVDIRAVDSVADRARYVTKYSTKPLHADVSKRHDKLCEFMTAIKGRRLYQCFGAWAKAVSRPKNPNRMLTPIGHINTVWMDALQGDNDAIFWMRIAHGRFPRLRAAYPLPPAGPPPAPPN